MRLAGAVLVLLLAGQVLVRDATCATRATIRPPASIAHLFETRIVSQRELDPGQRAYQRVLHEAPSQDSPVLLRARSETPDWLRQHATGRVGASWIWEDANTVLALRDRDLRGIVHDQDQVLVLSPLGNGVHALRRVQASDSGPHDCLVDPNGIGADLSFQSKRIAPGAGDRIRTVRPGDVTIRVLAVYTGFADDLTPNLPGHIELLVAYTNTAFERSRIQEAALGPAPRLELASTMRVEYDEIRENRTALREFADPADGPLDSIHAVRDSVLADVCVLFTGLDQPSSSGVALSDQPHPDRAFCLVETPYSLTHPFILAHEIGHLQDAQHQDNRSSSRTYAKGFCYIPPGLGFENALFTIMCTQNPIRIPYFSNPDVVVETPSGGPVPLGDASHDNARALNETALLVASHRGSIAMALSNLRATVLPEFVVRLEWRLLGPPQADGAKIFLQRSQSAAGPYVERAELTVGPARFMSFEDDEVLAANIYWYRFVFEHADGTLAPTTPLAVELPYGGLQGPEAITNLFEDQVLTQDDLDPTQLAYAQVLTQQPTTGLPLAVVLIQPDAPDRIREQATGRIGASWILEEENTLLVLRDDDLRGIVSVEGRVLVISPLGQGAHALRWIQATGPGTENCRVDATGIGGVHTAHSARTTTTTQRVGSKIEPDQITIRVLALYTSLAESLTPQMPAHIEFLTAYANRAFAASQIRESGLGPSPRLELARIVRVESDENRDHATALRDLARTDDGWLDPIHAIRDSVQADVCVLWTGLDQPLANGLALSGPHHPDRAFCLVETPYSLNSPFVLGHEIGHLQGAEHPDDPSSSRTYAQGFCYAPPEVGSENHIFTLMCTQNPVRIPFFSNPDVQYETPNGDRVGIGDALHHNARVLGETALSVASNRGLAALAIRDLGATVLPEYVVQLEWDVLGPPALDGVGIRVQRAPTATGPFENKATLVVEPDRRMSFMDHDVLDTTTYWYRLDFERTDGSSGATQAVNAVVPPRRLVVFGIEPWAQERGYRIRYGMGPTPGEVVMTLYDVRGRLIRVLAREFRRPGQYTVTWNQNNTNGVRATRGVYLLRVRVGTQTVTRKFPILNR